MSDAFESYELLDLEFDDPPGILTLSEEFSHGNLDLDATMTYGYHPGHYWSETDNYHRESCRCYLREGRRYWDGREIYYKSPFADQPELTELLISELSKIERPIPLALLPRKPRPKQKYRPLSQEDILLMARDNATLHEDWCYFDCQLRILRGEDVRA